MPVAEKGMLGVPTTGIHVRDQSEERCSKVDSELGFERSVR